MGNAMSATMGRIAASIGLQTGAESKTITIYDPTGTSNACTATFQTAKQFEKFMDRGEIPCLFKDGEGACIDEFIDLVPGATYTISGGNIRAGVRKLEQYFKQYEEQLVAQGKQEFGCAIIEDLRLEGIQVEELAEELVTEDAQGGVAEVDVAVRYVDGTGFVLGSMKTNVSGDSDVYNLQKQILQFYEQRGPFAGHQVQVAFMTETTWPAEQFERLKATCKRHGVRLYARNSRSISRVQLRAAARSIRLGLV